MATNLHGTRQTRRDDRRRTILAAAERFFLAHGYAATSMSTLAAELGGSKTTLWTYFPSKEALFLAVLDAKIGDFVDQLEETLVPAGGTAAALDRFGRALLTRLLSPDSEALRRLLASEAHRVPGMAHAYFERGPRRTRERLARFFAAEMAAGRLRPGDPALAARQFLALCQAGAFQDRFWHAPEPAAPDIAGDVAAAVEAFGRAWGVSSAPPPSCSPAG